MSSIHETWCVVSEYLGRAGVWLKALSSTCTAGLLLPLGTSMTHTGTDRLVTWHICTSASGYFKHKETDQNQTQAAGMGNLPQRCNCDFLALYKPLTLGVIKSLYHYTPTQAKARRESVM